LTNELEINGPFAGDSVEPLHWEVRLGAVNPMRRWAVLACAVLAGFAGLVLFRQPIFGVFGFLAIVLSTTEVLFPSKYRLDREGARAQCGMSVTTIAWENVKKVSEDALGVLVSPLQKSSRLDVFRGVYLRFADNRTEVLAKIREFTDGKY